MCCKNKSLHENENIDYVRMCCCCRFIWALRPIYSIWWYFMEFYENKQKFLSFELAQHEQAIAINKITYCFKKRGLFHCVFDFIQVVNIYTCVLLWIFPSLSDTHTVLDLQSIFVHDSNSTVVKLLPYPLSNIHMISV